MTTKLERGVPSAIRTWEKRHLPLFRKKTVSEAERRRRIAAGHQLCEILDDLAGPLATSVAGKAWPPNGNIDRRRAAEWLRDAGARDVDYPVARFCAFLTVVSVRLLPGLVWRTASRFERFTIRPLQGDSVLCPWEVSKAVRDRQETGGLAFGILAHEADNAITGYRGGKRWRLETLEPFLQPVWPTAPK